MNIQTLFFLLLENLYRNSKFLVQKFEYLNKKVIVLFLIYFFIFKNMIFLIKKLPKIIVIKKFLKLLLCHRDFKKFKYLNKKLILIDVNSQFLEDIMLWLKRKYSPFTQKSSYICYMKDFKKFEYLAIKLTLKIQELFLKNIMVVIKLFIKLVISSVWINSILLAFTPKRGIKLIFHIFIQF